MMTKRAPREVLCNPSLFERKTGPNQVTNRISISYNAWGDSVLKVECCEIHGYHSWRGNRQHAIALRQVFTPSIHGAAADEPSGSLPSDNRRKLPILRKRCGFFSFR